MTFINRRQWLNSCRLGLITGGSCFAYGSLHERSSLQVEHTSIRLPDAHRHLHGMKIALLADLHFDDFGDAGMVRDAVRAINRENVDIVLLAGDFVSHQTGVLPELGALLGELKAETGVYAVLGNHDHWIGSRIATDFLTRTGFRLLRNESLDLGEFTLAGLESAWGGHPDVRRVLAGAHPDKPIILGWHEPDTFDWYRDERVILQLSGHTHGGQICAPGYGPLILPRFGKKYPAGLFERNGANLYVTRGIGVISIPARFCCPPEVTILSLEGQAARQTVSMRNPRNSQKSLTLPDRPLSVVSPKTTLPN